MPFELTRQTWTALSSACAFVLLALLLVVVPVPYVIYSPGQAFDVLADPPGTPPAVKVDGLPSYPTPGQLHMTTVAVSRHDARTSLPEALFAYWLPGRAAMWRDSVYFPGTTTEEVQQRQRVMMDTSKQDATVAALRAANVPVEEVPVVRSVSVSGPAHQRLHPGDLILAVNSRPATTPEQAGQLISDQPVGESVRFTVEREGRIVNVDVTTASSNPSVGVPSVGIEIGVGYRYEPTVSFGGSQEVGGSSAGLVFALAIYDEITPQELINGRSVAGTGGIDPRGRVGRIDGLQQKIATAERVGATVFLVPSGNCRDLAGLRPNLELIRVDTLGDAIEGLRNLEDPATIAEVPRC